VTCDHEDERTPKGCNERMSTREDAQHAVEDAISRVGTEVLVV